MRLDDTRIGIFGLLAGTLLALGALLVFARYPAFFRTGRQYRAAFRSVAGLNPGGEVRYGGLPVGVVTRMDIDPHDPGRIEVVFRVRRDTPIHSDTRAAITQVGFLGEPYLHLEPGRSSAPALAEGGTLPSVENPSFQDAMRRVAVFLDRSDTLLQSAQQFVTTASPQRVEHTLTRIDTLLDVATRGSTGTFARLDRTFARVDTTFTQVNRASDRLATLLDRSERLLSALDTTVRATGPGLATTQREALQTVQELRALVGDLRIALQEEGGIDQLVRNMAVASDNIARLSERVERDPTSVLKRRSAPAKPAGPKVRQ